MIEFKRIVRTAGLAAILAGCFALPVCRSAAASFTWAADDSSISLLSEGKPVWQFQYGKDLRKPMFHPLALPDGTVLTWDKPPDHPWHHALWFSWKYLNHANYWEEGRGDKETEGITEWRNVSVTRGQDFSATIRMELTYHEPCRPPLLTERREIRISAPRDGQYHLDWTMIITAQEDDVDLNRTPIVGEEKGQHFGGYAGLSVRFARELREWRAVSTKGTIPQDHFHAESGAQGSDFSGRIAGQEAGVALLDYPSNLNAPTPWYTVMNPQRDFAFVQAAVIYYRPYVLKARQSLTLRYRVVVHGGRWSPEDLRAAQQKYVKEVEKEK